MDVITMKIAEDDLSLRVVEKNKWKIRINSRKCALKLPKKWGCLEINNIEMPSIFCSI
jgi:hypothetical protein